MNFRAIALSVVLAAPAVFACEGDGHHMASNEPKKVTIAEVAKLTSTKKATMVDANNNEFRAKNGVIPGAVLLTSSSGFQLSELPAAKDSKLVFYCANERCGASEGAAKKAVQAGYTDVNFLPDGLMGWKNAGQKTASFKPNS